MSSGCAGVRQTGTKTNNFPPATPNSCAFGTPRSTQLCYSLSIWSAHTAQSGRSPLKDLLNFFYMESSCLSVSSQPKSFTFVRLSAWVPLSGSPTTVRIDRVELKPWKQHMGRAVGCWAESSMCRRRAYISIWWKSRMSLFYSIQIPTRLVSNLSYCVWVATSYALVFRCDPFFLGLGAPQLRTNLEEIDTLEHKSKYDAARLSRGAQVVGDSWIQYDIK